MNQHEYFSMDTMGRLMYDAQQEAVARAHESLWETLFGRVEPSWSWEEIAEATRKHRRDYAIHRIRSQPFFMPNAELSGPRPLAAEGSRSNDGLEAAAENEERNGK